MLQEIYIITLDEMYNVIDEEKMRVKETSKNYIVITIKNQTKREE